MRKLFAAVLAACLIAAGPAFAAEQQEAAGGNWEVQDPKTLSVPAPAAAPAQPTAAEMQEMMQGMMGPMMAEMMSSMLKSMSKTMAEPQIAQNLATFTRNYYQALIDRGFTEEQALKIVTSTGVPNLGGKS